MALLKLNLGCGNDIKAGYVNVDKFSSNADLQFDLETHPWPWPNDSVTEIVLSHVLEHLGRDTDIFLAILKEMYRVCAPGAEIHISVPHPRHDDFITDPTHVRPILPASFTHLSKRLNRQWATDGYPNTPLGLYLDIDFEIEEVRYQLDTKWMQQFSSGEINQQDLDQAIHRYNNVIREIHIRLKAVK